MSQTPNEHEELEVPPSEPPEAQTFEDILANVSARFEDEVEDEEGEDSPSPDEDGPEDSVSPGELSEESEDVEPEAEDPESDVEEEEVDASDEQPEESEPKAEATVDPRDEEISKLKEIVEAGQNQNQQLLALMQQFVAVSKQQQSLPASKPEADLPDEVVQLALFGGDEKAWESTPVPQRKKAEKLAKSYMERTVRYAKNPQAIYDEIRDKVLADVQQMVQPALAQTEQQRVNSLLKQHLHEDSNRERVGQIFAEKVQRGIPAETALALAVDMERLEASQRNLAERERAVRASEKQKQANKKAAKRTAKRGSRRAPPNQRPKWEPGDDPLSYARRLQEQGIE